MTASPIGRAPATAIAGVAATVLMWAAAYPGIAMALPDFTPVGLAAFRYLVAAIALAGMAVVAPPSLPLRRDLGRIAAAGALGISIYNILLNLGQMTVNAGTASLLVGITPIIAALFGCLFLGERLRWTGWIGTGLSFIGATLTSIARSQGDVHLSSGAILVLAAAVCLAAMFVVQKPLVGRYRPLSVAMWIVWAGAIFLLPFLPEGLESARSAAFMPLAAAIFLGIGPAALAYVAWAYALAYFPVSRASSFLYLVAPTALILSYFTLGEIPSILVLVGGAMTLIGVVLVNSFGRQPMSREGVGSNSR